MTLLGAALAVSAPCALADCPSSACGNGSDGAYAPTTSGNFTPSQFHGTGVANNVFNFTTITIPAGVTITVTSGIDNAPVYWLATGNVDIEGTVSLDGQNGNGATSDVDLRVPALAGSGGYGGGVGGNSYNGQNATPGGGPRGGGVGDIAGHCNGGAGFFTGNQYLIPLIGGSGGGGGYAGSGFGPGGGAGGGAILIASSTQITVGGTVSANGGKGGCYDYNYGDPVGSGGAIRLVSNTISGAGTLTAVGDWGFWSNNPGRVRLEASTIGTSFNFNSTPVSESTPLSNFSSFIPSTPQLSVQVTSVNGVPITENPFSFPDITINTDQPVPVVITGHQVPIGTIPTLIILGETADQDLTCTGGLQGTVATSTCTINITFAPLSGSRGLVKATWTQ